MDVTTSSLIKQPVKASTPTIAGLLSDHLILKHISAKLALKLWEKINVEFPFILVWCLASSSA